MNLYLWPINYSKYKNGFLYKNNNYSDQYGYAECKNTNYSEEVINYPFMAILSTKIIIILPNIIPILGFLDSNNNLEWILEILRKSLKSQ